MKEITDVTVIKRRIQKRKRGVPYWNANLEEERCHVKALNRQAIESGDVVDARLFKHNHKF